MAKRLVWLWPSHPLSDGGRNIQREVTAADGRVVSLRVPAKEKCDAPGFNSATAFVRRKFYVPTMNDLAVIKRTLPDAEPGNPSWARIFKQLQAGGLENVRRESASKLIELLMTLEQRRFEDVPRSQIEGDDIEKARIELRQFWQDGFLKRVSMSQAVDADMQALGPPRVDFCEPGDVSWPHARLIELWRLTAPKFGSNVIQTDVADYGLSAFLFSRTQKRLLPTGCFADIIDPIGVWLDALAGAKDGRTMQSLVPLIEPDPTRATAFDLGQVASLAERAAAEFRQARDDYPKRITQALQDQHREGEFVAEGKPVPHYVANNLVISMDSLRRSELKLLKLANNIEVIAHYARALLPDEFGKCEELGKRRWQHHGDYADCERLGVELRQLGAKLQWLKPPQKRADNLEPQSSETLSNAHADPMNLKPAEVRRLLRRVEDERDGLAATPCKLFDLRILHTEGDGKQWDSELLQSHSRYAEFPAGSSIGYAIDPFGPKLCPRVTRLFCDELGETTTAQTLSRPDWYAIATRLDALDDVVRRVSSSRLVTDETRAFCRQSSKRQLWCRFVAGLSWQPNSPIDECEITWPAASEINTFSWERRQLCWQGFRKYRTQRNDSSGLAGEIEVGISQAEPPDEWIGNPPANFFEVTIPRFIENSVRVCNWLIEWLKSPGAVAQQLPVATATKDKWMRFVDAEALTGLNRGNLNRAANAGEIVDNGLKGKARRIDRESFTHWWQRKSSEVESPESVARKLGERR